MKAGLQRQPLLEDGHEHVDRHRNPDLSFDRVLAISVKGLDSEVLLDPFEELNDILPINNALLKLPFTTTFIRYARTACQ